MKRSFGDSHTTHQRLHSSQRPALNFKTSGRCCSPGNSLRRSEYGNPRFKDTVKNLIGLERTPRETSTTSHAATGGTNSQSQQSTEDESSISLLRSRRPSTSIRPQQTVVASEFLSPQKSKDSNNSVCSPVRRVSVVAYDSLSELRVHLHNDSLSTSSLGYIMQESSSATNKASSSLETIRHANQIPKSNSNRTKSNEEPEEEKRRTWMAFRLKKKTSRVIVRRAHSREKTTLSEPIVLSSEDDELGECDESRQSDQTLPVDQTPYKTPGVDPQQQSFLELEFLTFHTGLMHTDANGKMMITSSGIVFRFKGDEGGEVTVVASQLRGYGLCDGGLALGGTLLDNITGPAPSLLFLWVTDAQANLLHKEMAFIQTSSASGATGPPCPILLLVMTEQLSECKVALLTSMLELKEFRQACSPSANGLTSPLSWSDVLLIIHNCCTPLDEHLLYLLGQSPEMSSPLEQRSRNREGVLQLSTRLMQYPAPPSKGRITVTKEDLACLESGKYLNDVIIDFYLKYLLLEGGGRDVAERSHIFSSFFFKHLSTHQISSNDTSVVPDQYIRHQRVKTWTRHVDIFSKDFLFVPINKEAHWFLAVICFPGQEGARYEKRTRVEIFSRRAEQPPTCTEQGCMREFTLTRPCILVMDSLQVQQHENISKLLRDYLQVEWEERRGQHRVFNSKSMCSFSCRVAQQDNSSDCGLYLLQYVESFFQNPVVHFDLPLLLGNWFPQQQVRQKREEIRCLIMRLHKNQSQAE
ncbi:sentrin-specific protease 7-like isoform X2 [Corythoichthys intestinalis]|uniref:sentrin-specific protease 7-like isoform X2 n=1 Tax=Corythoichthys intestinalis TaxID=161448 RepID=UPI0025A54C74|nr:sentrin-specific protease 7-like isoform X2 [Corythoichthys intestinalis]